MNKPIHILLSLYVLLGFASCANLDVDRALESLYDDVPAARQEVEASAGYAVFSSFSLHPGVLSFASGRGEAINNRTGERTSMRTGRLGVGPGIAIKGFYLYLIFEDADDFGDFIDGRWGGGGLTEASLRFGEFGGDVEAMTVLAEGVEAYRRTHTGVALAALFKLLERKVIAPDATVVVISTAHGLKFPDFKVRYHEGRLGEIGVESRIRNHPVELDPEYDLVRDAIRRSLEKQERPSR